MALQVLVYALFLSNCVSVLLTFKANGKVILNEAIYVKLHISSLIHIIYDYCSPTLILNTVFTQFIINILW